MVDKLLKIECDRNTEIMKMWLCRFRAMCRLKSCSQRKWPSARWCAKHGAEEGKSNVDPYDIADMERNIEWDLERIEEMWQRNTKIKEVEDEII